MGLLERVDWEDKIPRNIRFMRVKVRIDLWLPVIVGFMLRLDDGSRVWIRCRYERVHKLCTKCGLIGHTRGQCTHCMEDIEIMLFCQRLRIQDLHQVQYRFDALQPRFTNDLRAFHNRRRWTTQDILNSIQAFFHSGSLLKSLNQTFLTFIPKVSNPEEKPHLQKNVNFISLAVHPSRRASTLTNFSPPSLIAVKLHSTDPTSIEPHSAVPHLRRSSRRVTPLHRSLACPSIHTAVELDHHLTAQEPPPVPIANQQVL
nr:hypothetical protein CFP56_31168 [Quercus suber]